MDPGNEKDLHKIFSSNLRYWTNIRGKRQDDIVKKFGLSSSTVSSWFNGVHIPRMNKIQMLADYLEIEKHNLIEDNPKDIIAFNNNVMERKLSEAFNKMNDTGQWKVFEYVMDLAESNKYIK